MFKFLKDKIQETVEKISKKEEEDQPEEEQEESKEETEEEVEEEKKEKPKEESEEEKENKKKVEEKNKEVEEEIKKENLEEEIQEKGFLSKIKQKVTTRKISEDEFEKIFQDLELALLENNVAMEVTDQIKENLKEELTQIPTKRSEIEKTIKEALKNSIEKLFLEPPDLISNIKKKKPYIICLVGVNGSGKTTTIAKLTKILQKENLKPVLAAADTFRAAAIDQLEHHANKLGVPIIKHKYGADPAAVVFDAVKYAESKHLDVVLADTSGRLHSNTNLMGELKKIIRVANPDLTIFIGEAITGNDAVEQANTFNEEIGVDAIILSKQDIDEKGGTAISISHITKRPILYIATGQEYDDLETFNKEKILEQLGLC